MKNIVLGSIFGIFLALVFITFLTFVHDVSIRQFFEIPFAFINQVLEKPPFFDFLKERQSPLFSLIAVLLYWAGLGAVGGGIYFLMRKKLSRNAD